MSNKASLTYSDEISDKLLKLMSDTGYSIVQVNGQRIFYSPRQDRTPPRGCEVFVGKIPRDCYEDELCPLFMRVGRIFQLRLMMMFSGTNRGYAFVMYEHLEDAERAVQTLDNYEIRRGHRIGVLPCVNNCRLFLGFFGAGEKSEDELEEILRSETEGVVSVSRRQSGGGRAGAGRWHALVEYSNHRSAAIARRELTPRRHQLFGPRAIVDWEVPLDKRGRKMALEQRRGNKTTTPGFRLYEKPPIEPNFKMVKQADKNCISKEHTKLHPSQKQSAPTYWRDAISELQHRDHFLRADCDQDFTTLSRSMNGCVHWKPSCVPNKRPHTSPNLGFTSANSPQQNGKSYMEEIAHLSQQLSTLQSRYDKSLPFTNSQHIGELLDEVHRPLSSDSSTGSVMSSSVSDHDTSNYNSDSRRNSSDLLPDWPTEWNHLNKEDFVIPQASYLEQNSNALGWKRNMTERDDLDLMMNLFDHTSDFGLGFGTSLPQQNITRRPFGPEPTGKHWASSHSDVSDQALRSCSLLSQSFGPLDDLRTSYNHLFC